MIRQLPILDARRRPVLPSRYSVVWLLLIVIALTGALRLLVGIYQAQSASPGARSRLSSIFTPEVRYWSPLIFSWAAAYNVDPNLIATVIQIESCGDPEAVSRSGAQGLFQVMPFHFQAGEDMLEVLTNGRHGMEYLASSLQIAGGDPGLALAGYNGGHGVIHMEPDRWSDETRRYYQWGSGIYQDAAQGLGTSASVQAWLKAGGRALCERASNHQLVQGLCKVR